MVLRIFANDLHVAVGRQVARDALERLPVVPRDEYVRLQVVAAMAVDRDVRGAGVEMRRVDPRNPVLMVRGQPRQVSADFREVRPAVAAHLQVAVVGARPDDARQYWRFRDGNDRAAGIYPSKADTVGYTNLSQLGSARLF